MQVVWTSHLKSPEEKKKFEEYLRNATTLTDRLEEILTSKIKGSKEEDYEKASWAYYQADQNGYNRALQEILELFKYNKVVDK